jgi:hypothetical protein
MDLSDMIKECSMLVQLKELEEKYTQSEEDRNALFEQRIKMFVKDCWTGALKTNRWGSSPV